MQDSAITFVKIQDFLNYIGKDFVDKISKSEILDIDTSPKFSFICSKYYANLILKSKTPMALLRTVLPQKIENNKVYGFVDDPVGDLPAAKTNCVIQKYIGRALVVSTCACGSRCRFCFRKNYPYKESKNIALDVSNWLDLHKDIWEIILSGGDPIMLSTEKLQNLILAISAHKSVTTLRIHTRAPAVRPDILNEHMQYLSNLPSRFNCVLVSHINHADELSETSAKIFLQLKNSGWTLLNQNVLLKGVNDDEETLINLYKKLFEQGVIPYYMHQLDKANGVAHFEVSDTKALELINNIRAKLPGYLVPKLVREIAGEQSKTPIV